MSTLIPITTRSCNGINVTLGPPGEENSTVFSCRERSSFYTVQFSPDGAYLAFSHSSCMKIVQTKSWDEIVVYQKKIHNLFFSPKSTYLACWVPYVSDTKNSQDAANLFIYKSESGELVKSFVQKQLKNWEPKWSMDEHLFSRMVNTDLVFYEDGNFDKIAHRIKTLKISTYSLSPMVGNYYVLCNSRSGQGQNIICSLFNYPNFDPQQSVAKRGLFEMDNIEYFWNSTGDYMLILTVVEVDNTGESYYGKQRLYFMGIKGQSIIVVLSKKGPIHSVCWSPKSKEFCIVYGFMPSKATLYNVKCEPVFEFGTEHRNSIYYNPQGNILLLGGFGNLPGQIELWDVDTRKLIAKCTASDTTMLEWSPEGTCFLTATTAPRLRISNGYKIWHYSGILVYEKAWNEGEELYEAHWQNYPSGTFKQPIITTEKVKGIVSVQPQASNEAYKPPSARNQQVKFQLENNEEELRKSPEGPVSKAYLKQKKKREARKARKLESDESEEVKKITSNVKVILTGDPEKDKKIKGIKKKLDAIEKLKDQEMQGKPLEVNQKAKIQTEAELIRELKRLQL